MTQGHDHDLSVGDIDGDGFPDLFAGVDNTLQFGGSLRFFARSRLYRNDRLGGFTLDASQPFSQRNGDVLDSDLVDIDGDGDLDLLTSDNILPEVDPVTSARLPMRNIFDSLQLVCQCPVKLGRQGPALFAVAQS